jgi:hypothetical protein
MQQSKDKPVVEIAIFKTKEGVTTEQLLGTVDAVSEWAKHQPGFVSRDLTYSGETDSWIDVIWWENLEAAQTAAEAAMTSESCAPMFGAIDLEGIEMVHGERMIARVVAEGTSIGA